MPRPKLLTLLEALFAVIVWGGSFIATKVALRDVSPITVVWLRFAMGVVILGIAVTARRQFALPKRNEWLYFALLGFLGITFHQWLQSTALTTSRASAVPDASPRPDKRSLQRRRSVSMGDTLDGRSKY